MLNDLTIEEAKELDLQACVPPRVREEAYARLMRRVREAKGESLSVSSSRGVKGGGAPTNLEGWREKGAESAGVSEKE